MGLASLLPQATTRSWPAAGGLITEALRADWIALIDGLDAAQKKGGPLDGWVFHGTVFPRAESIDVEGLQLTSAYVIENGCAIPSQGVHFGTPKVAAFFAEDLIAAGYPPDVGLVIYGAPLAYLERHGDLLADAYMVEIPLTCRLNVASEAHALRLWESSDQDWKACLNILGTVIVDAPIPAVLLKKFESPADLAAILTTPGRRSGGASARWPVRP